MTHFGIAVAWSALQATLVALAAALAYAAARRRAPAAAVAAAGGLAACAAVTLLALCPLPAWWTWQAALPAVPSAAAAPAVPPESASGAAVSESNSPAGPGAAAGGRFLELWRDLWTGAGPADSSAPRPSRWPAALAWAFLAGACLGLARLALGVAAARRLRRRSRAIDDPELTRLVDGLRAEMGCRPVALWECPDVAGPATVGWLRPLLLLPPGWRAWGGDERRAALAHELAHVRRSDYLGWLAACAGVALHFYHPLVYWLAGRLRLQQELAADALAARHAGGPAAYLRALAALAVRLDGPAPAWPARPLVSSPGTLMRRVAMLRTTDGRASRPLPRGARAGLVALLAALAAGASALRCPAQKDAGPAPAPTPAAADGGGRPPFDLTYLPPEGAVVAFRPAAVFARPEMKNYAKAVDGDLGKLGELLGLGADWGLRVEDIEQVTASVVVQTQKAASGPQSAALCHFVTVRTTGDFDWARRLRALPGAEEVRHAGQTYFKVPTHVLGGRIDGTNEALAVYVPDVRTAVFDSEAAVRKFLDRRGAPPPERPWAADWRRVERGVFALALDTRDKGWLRARRQPEKELPAAAVTLAEKADSLVVGLDVTDRVLFQTLAHAADAKATAELAESARGWAALGLKGLEKARKEGKELWAHKPAGALVEGFLRRAAVTAEPGGVRWSSEARGPLAELATAMGAAELLFSAEAGPAAVEGAPAAPKP
jgi:beta-lactamase regulating signal transducer with metallopeptidase domain